MCEREGKKDEVALIHLTVFSQQKKELAKSALCELSQAAPRAVLPFALGQLYFTRPTHPTIK